MSRAPSRAGRAVQPSRVEVRDSAPCPRDHGSWADSTAIATAIHRVPPLTRNRSEGISHAGRNLALRPVLRRHDDVDVASANRGDLVTRLVAPEHRETQGEAR